MAVCPDSAKGVVVKVAVSPYHASKNLCMRAAWPSLLPSPYVYGSAVLCLWRQQRSRELPRCAAARRPL